MVPHAETLCRLNDLEHEEHLRHAAQQRRAHDAVSSRLRPDAGPTTLLAAASWLRSFLARARGAKLVQMAPPTFPRLGACGAAGGLSLSASKQRLFRAAEAPQDRPRPVPRRRAPQWSPDADRPGATERAV
jgi:hypothetical protein